MSSFVLASRALADAPGAHAGLVDVAPGVVVIAAVLVVVVALSAVALLREIRLDGYGADRPRPMTDEYPWQVTWAPPRARTARPWAMRRRVGAARR